MSRRYCSIFLFILITGLSFGQTEMEIRHKTDWATGMFELDITAAIEEEPNQPTGRFKTEQAIIRQSPEITGDVLQKICVNSTHMIGDLVNETPLLLRQLENLSEKMQKVFTTATADRKYLTVRYTLPLFPDLADLVIRHEKPFPSPEGQVYTANEEFTGIVIYAGEPLPFQGNVEKNESLAPCLFPRLFDTSMNLIHSAEMTEPGALRQWGNVGYSYDFDLSRHSSRIGVYPLRTMARKIYGTNRTDLILDDDTVIKLISSENNRELLRQGRVLIILPPEEDTSDSVDSP